MSGIFGSDEPRATSGSPREEPSSATDGKADALIATEQQRSEQQRIDAIQRQLRLETSSRSRGYGLRSLFGSLGQGRSSLLGSG